MGVGGMFGSVLISISLGFLGGIGAILAWSALRASAFQKQCARVTELFLDTLCIEIDDPEKKVVPAYCGHDLKERLGSLRERARILSGFNLLSACRLAQLKFGDNGFSASLMFDAMFANGKLAGRVHITAVGDYMQIQDIEFF